jgi:chemotaxis protein CheX
MKVSNDDISNFTKNIWSSFLGLDVIPAEHTTLKPTDRPYVSGCVTFAGQWNGAVTIDCCMELAREAAGKMFEMEPGSVSSDEVRDALGELVNMLAGNVKTVLPDSCNISLPSVTQGTDYQISISGGEVVCRLGFKCENKAMLVTLLECNGKDHKE